MPTEFAKTAERLTASDIEVPELMDADSIISWLEYDAIGYKRPDTGYVTYGAVEYDYSGIKEDGSFDILTLPNPTDGDFTIIFDNPIEQKIIIEMFDLESKKVINICNEIVSAGYQVYRVDIMKKPLASATYFIRFMVGDELFIRKVIVKK